MLNYATTAVAFSAALALLPACAYEMESEEPAALNEDAQQAPDLDDPYLEPTVFDSTCPYGNVCFWRQPNYQGTKQVYGAIWAPGPWPVDANWNPYQSVKNRFTGRAVLIINGSTTVGCIRAGDHASFTPTFTRFYIGASGSTCF